MNFWHIGACAILWMWNICVYSQPHLLFITSGCAALFSLVEKLLIMMDCLPLNMAIKCLWLQGKDCHWCFYSRCLISIYIHAVEFSFYSGVGGDDRSLLLQIATTSFNFAYSLNILNDSSKRILCIWKCRVQRFVRPIVPIVRPVS